MDEKHVIWSSFGLEAEEWMREIEVSYPDLSE